MKNNESPIGASPMPGDVGMTAEELRLYRSLLDTAYPTPKRDIKAGVMAAIAAEQADPKILHAIPDAAVKKKQQRALFMKWGSLAACIALVAGIGLRTLPTLLNNPETADQAAVAYDAVSHNPVEAPDALRNSTALMSEGALYKAIPDATAENGAAIAEEEEVRDYADEEIDEQLEDASDERFGHEESAEAPAEEAAAEKDDDDAPTEEAVAENATADGAEAPVAPFLYSIAGPGAANGITEPYTPALSCAHTDVFRDSYHDIPKPLLDEVGQSEFNAWANEVTRTDPCAANIYTFLTHFDISETMFTMFLSTTDIAYYCDYPVDLLYGGDANAVETYYANGGDYDRMVADYFEYEFKLALVKEIGVSAYTTWLDEVGVSCVRGWSIAAFVTDHGVTPARFEEVYTDVAAEITAEFPDVPLHSYDLTLLYVPNAQTAFAQAMGTTGYRADVACRK